MGKRAVLQAGFSERRKLMSSPKAIKDGRDSARDPLELAKLKLNGSVVLAKIDVHESQVGRSDFGRDE